MVCRRAELVDRWCDLAGIDPGLRPNSASIVRAFPDAFRPGVEPEELAAWERRHGFELPQGLKNWLVLSNGLFTNGPLIHPLSAIGPMVPFASIPGLVVQPESWFELGNPNVETVCIDLAYRWPDGDYPVFTSGDETCESVPRVIASGFDAWFLAVLASDCREFWFDPGFCDLGDPWLAHLRYVPAPALPDRLRPFADRVSHLVGAGLDDRAIAAWLGISPFDVEAISRHVQHLLPTADRVPDDVRKAL